ncbi:TPA: hypothetical protein DCY43_03400 [candidate division WWE3 bacterium]|uniref:(P)ppGpp synthetase I, SpoT/RelA n=4 Tax=Katanobacteria TaxID=422282 RepID=A0A0G1KD06_UNCKA|nr:MAG: (P)ppGpp synthetase I, SpoT/RelA [candidate division WWE3 bacterium GW2011_GWA2_44_16]OGC51305.1 MAG: hypothetical protein A2709_01195 [candidate division WWE3 bacterium RIFCSPHIGHO2_01_FULL_43_9]HAZ29759.1 hypothetical protein [candidate division WWE3 bacterium]
MSNMLEKAKELAHKIHTNTTRASGDPLVDHLANVCEKLTSAGITDEIVLASAWLHHMPEAATDAANLISSQVGAEVANIVELYHNLRLVDIKKESPKHFNENYIVQTYMNLAQDMRVLVLALANQAHNIETAHALPQVKRLETAEKTLYLYAPIGKMLGISDFTKTLENEAFKILNPAEYLKIKTVIEEKTPQIKAFFEQAVSVVGQLLEESGVKAQVSYRIKHIYSTYRKAERYKDKGDEVGEDFSSIYDLAAMRIVVDTEEQVYLVESLLSSLWDQLPHLRNDYILKPRPTGYRSLHNVFRVENNLHIEVQIRTYEMHQEAEYGVCSHLFYKIGEKFKNELANNPNWVKELNYFEAYKPQISHFDKNVYAFTPKGDIIELPKGAKAIDFAYYVHTDIGDGCVGAKINGIMAKIDTVINDGDVVEILVDKNKKTPSRDWLSMVGTKKAKWEILKRLRLAEK